MPDLNVLRPYGKEIVEFFNAEDQNGQIPYTGDAVQYSTKTWLEYSQSWRQKAEDIVSAARSIDIDFAIEEYIMDLLVQHDSGSGARDRFGYVSDRRRNLEEYMVEDFYVKDWYIRRADVALAISQDDLVKAVKIMREKK